MSESVAISAQHLDKVYKLYDSPSSRLKEAMHPLRRKFHSDFHALRDLSFEINHGETMGILGANGSGKSTLLKILSGVLTPSTGSVLVNGTISALLELGAGFNPELTGLENIFLNGTITGHTRSYTEQRLDDILSFADIGIFIGQPVKTYSSGMFARLAFAVAINVNPDILIVDEILSVGDASFQARCYRRFHEFQDQGKTVVLVTHDMNSIIRHCSRTMVLDHGSKCAEGEPGDMVDVYKQLLTGNKPTRLSSRTGPRLESVRADGITALAGTGLWKESIPVNPGYLEYGDGRARIIDYGLFDEQGNTATVLHNLQQYEIRYQVKFHVHIDEPVFGFAIKNVMGMELTGTNTSIEKVLTGTYRAGDEVTVSFRQRINLQDQHYFLSIGCVGYEKGNLVVYHRLYDVVVFQVIGLKAIAALFDPESIVSIGRSVSSAPG